MFGAIFLPPSLPAYRLAAYVLKYKKMEKPQCKLQNTNPTTHNCSVHGASQSQTIMIIRMVQSGNYPVRFAVEPVQFPAVQPVKSGPNPLQ